MSACSVWVVGDCLGLAGGGGDHPAVAAGSIVDATVVDVFSDNREMLVVERLLEWTHRLVFGRPWRRLLGMPGAGRVRAWQRYRQNEALRWAEGR